MPLRQLPQAFDPPKLVQDAGGLFIQSDTKIWEKRGSEGEAQRGVRDRVPEERERKGRQTRRSRRSSSRSNSRRGEGGAKPLEEGEDPSLRTRSRTSSAEARCCSCAAFSSASPSSILSSLIWRFIATASPASNSAVLRRDWISARSSLSARFASSAAASARTRAATAASTAACCSLRRSAARACTVTHALSCAQSDDALLSASPDCSASTVSASIDTCAAFSLSTADKRADSASASAEAARALRTSSSRPSQRAVAAVAAAAAARLASLSAAAAAASRSAAAAAAAVAAAAVDSARCNARRSLLTSPRCAPSRCKRSRAIASRRSCTVA
eukprot:2673055-Pleurochrysis_carterae.AAC.4